MTIQRREVVKFKMPLIEKDINGKNIMAVNLRELHFSLGSKQEFANWIKDRIEKYDFVKGKDYLVVFDKVVENPKGGRPRIEYYGTVTMAKELAMVENNIMGKRARKYFIQCEEKLYRVYQLDSSIQRLETLPISSLGFEQLSLKDRKVQQNHFHQIFRSFGLTKGRRSHIRIKMCAAVNLVINGMSSYRFRQLTEVTGKTRDWMPRVNQYALYRTEFDLLQMCIERNYQMTFAELEQAYVELARLNKQIVEFSYHVQLHDAILDHVRDVLAEARQQLQDDKVSPYQITEGQLYHEMEQRALLLDELTQKLSESQS